LLGCVAERVEEEGKQSESIVKAEGKERERGVKEVGKESGRGSERRDNSHHVVDARKVGGDQA
jgi:hypothetical protein